MKVHKSALQEPQKLCIDKQEKMLYLMFPHAPFYLMDKFGS